MRAAQLYPPTEMAACCSCVSAAERYTARPSVRACVCSERSTLPRAGFQWSGCSDNLSYGVAFSQTFVDETERAKGLSLGRPLMNIHNNEAGRKVRDSVKT